MFYLYSYRLFKSDSKTQLSIIYLLNYQKKQKNMKNIVLESARGVKNGKVQLAF